MKKHKKVIIMVMSSNQPTFQTLENTIKETWYNLKNDDVEIIFYKENNTYVTNNVVYEHPNLYLPCSDGYYSCGQKTLLALEWVQKNYEFDYIYRSNLGAFINVKNLINFLEDKPKEKFYCGILGINNFLLGEEIRFASGSGFFLSKDVVEIVLNSKNLWNHNVIDDVALGYVLLKFNIKVDERALRKNICDGIESYQNGVEDLEFIPEDEIYHIRLRSNNRILDVQNMIKIYKELEK